MILLTISERFIFRRFKYVYIFRFQAVLALKLENNVYINTLPFETEAIHV